MLIDKGWIELEREGAAIRYVHRDEAGQPLRVLSKQGFQSGALWQRAVDDWLANFHDKLPLKRLDGTMTTVAAYEDERA